MNILLSSIAQLLFFGALSALMIAHGPSPSAGVIALFGVGEMGGASMLCSLIVKCRRQPLPGWVVDNIVGFSVAHLCIFMFVPPACPQSTLAWMELTLRVSLLVVLTTAAAVLYRTRNRRLTATA